MISSLSMKPILIYEKNNNVLLIDFLFFVLYLCFVFTCMTGRNVGFIEVIRISQGVAYFYLLTHDNICYLHNCSLKAIYGTVDLNT